MDTHYGVPLINLRNLIYLFGNFWYITISCQITLETEIKKNNNNYDPEKGNDIALAWQENKNQRICAVEDPLQRCYSCIDSYMFIQCYNWLVTVLNHSLGPPAMYITVFSKDSCNYYKSFVKSARHSSFDKEALITILMICEPTYSPGNNSNVYNILKV